MIDFTPRLITPPRSLEKALATFEKDLAFAQAAGDWANVDKYEWWIWIARTELRRRHDQQGS